MKLLKAAAVALGAIAALAVVAAAVAWLTFDPNDYKGYLADWVEARTGRAFAVEDDLELTFFPWLGVTTGGVSLGNAPGFGEEPFASVERVTVSVRLLPLLRRQVEIGTVRLDGLELDLATDAQGRGNWSGLAGGPAEAAPGAPQAGPREPLLRSLNIAGVDINDGVIFWRSDASEVRYVLSDLRVETGEIAPGRPVDGELAFRLVGVDPQLSADVTASGTLVLGADGADLQTRDLRLAFNLDDGRGTERAAGSLQVDNIRVGLTDDAIDVARGNLTAMVVEPPVGPQRAEVQVDWTGALIERGDATLRVEDLATSVAGVVARWELSGSNLLDAPALSGSVRIDRQPLTAVVDALGVALDADTRRGLGELSLRSAFTARPLTREATFTNLTADALGVSLEGELGAGADGSISGRFATAPFDPAVPLGLLPAETRERVDIAAIGPVSASGTFRYAADERLLSVRDLDLAALGAQLNGELNRRGGGQRYDGTVTIESLDADALAPVLGELMPAALSPGALGELALSAQFGYAPGAGTLELAALDARAAGLDLRGELGISSLADSPRWTGRIELAAFDPEVLLRRFERPVPERRDPAAFRRARASAQIEGDASGGTARDLRLVLDDSTITGELSVRFTEPARYGFDLAVDRLDADRYLPPAEDRPPAGVAPVAADIALPTEPLRALRLDGRLAVDDLRLAGLSLRDVAAGVAVDEGLGAIDSVSATLYGGHFEGRVELDARGEQPRLSLDGTATTLQLEPLLAALRGTANMTGAGSFDLNLAGSGTALTEVLDSAAGRVSFSARDGQLRGFDLGRSLCSAYNATQSLPRPPASAEPITSYRLLRGSANVTEGIARTEDLEATTAFMSVTGQGQSDLLSREINYDLVATLTDSIRIDGCQSMDRLIGDAVPVRVTGTILEPDIQPDYRAIVRGRIRDELQDRLRERLESLGR